jgi:hypothetical protein
MYVTHPPNPPVVQWVRVPRAASRLGMSPKMLLSEIEGGRLPCRLVHLGRNRIAHVAEGDIDLASRTLATRCLPGGAR